MPIHKNELTKEMMEKLMQCKTAEELMALAKAEEIGLTKDEAETYLAELSDYEIKDGELKDVAGGSMQGPSTNRISISVCYMVSYCRKDAYIMPHLRYGEKVIIYNHKKPTLS